MTTTKRSLVTALAAFGFALAANATTDIKSEYFYQAETDNNYLRPEINYNSGSNKMKNQTKEDRTGQNLNLFYERGLNDMYAIGGAVGYQNSQIEQGNVNNDVKGLKDITLYGKGRYSFVEGSTMNYGLNLYLSPGERTVDTKNTSKTQTDAVSGGNALRPYLGYQWLLGSHVLGTHVYTDFLLGKRSLKVESSGSTTAKKVEGGEETALTVFYEIPHEMGAVGFNAFYKGVADTKTNGKNDGVGHDEMGLGVYSPYRFSEMATVIGKLNWSQWANSSVGGDAVDSTSNLEVSVAGRFLF